MSKMGRPKKPLAEVKSEKAALRMSLDTKKFILLYYGSIQTFFDVKVAEDKGAKHDKEKDL